VIEIRPCHPDEIPLVLKLWSEATDIRATDTEEALQLLVDGDALLVAVDGEQFVGSVIAGWDGWRGNIYRLAVAPTHRRRGIATALLTEAEKRLRAAGAPRMSMLVDGQDPDATAFWRSVGGIVLDDKIRRYIKDLD
jgi:ribosomal protein S18 acetylase RimI-like enzyme